MYIDIYIGYTTIIYNSGDLGTSGYISGDLRCAAQIFIHVV